ncbi:MAG TPA: response regulator [Pirellulales bacterium]|nr:response regulator [Pirellulales bacterium]
MGRSQQSDGRGRSAADDNLRGVRILCIDDDPDVVRAIETCLATIGAVVSCAYNGRQGHWLALTEKPDLVITDIAMPLGAGGDIVECLQRNSETQDIPVVVLSGRRDDRLKQRLLKGGVKRWLMKPMRHEELLAAVRSLATATEPASPVEARHDGRIHSRFAC